MADTTATLTADQVIRQARRRLDTAAAGHRSYVGPYDLDRLRSVSIDKLHVWALAVAHQAGRLPAARAELDVIVPIARGRADAVAAAITAGGVGALVDRMKGV